MPNEALIQQLDALRETYTRQQKSATSLQAALKGVTNTHTRAVKALVDYQDQNASVEVADVQAMFINARIKEDVVDPLTPQLRRELKSLAKLTSALRDAVNALRSEPVDVARLDKAITNLQTASQADVLDLLPELSSELDLGQRALSQEFGQKLRTALAEQGIQIGGRAPKFEIGRFELEANFARRMLTVRYGHDMVIPRVAVTVEAVIKAYQSAAKQVTQRTQDGKAWMAQFYDAYRIAQRKRDLEQARVNLVDCYMEFVLLRQGRAFASEPSKRNFNDYSRAQFIYDFYEFTSRQRLAHNNLYVRAHTATKSQADSPTKSMWIVEGDTPYNGRYIADVEFVKD